jgi:predicted Zn-dependent protease
MNSFGSFWIYDPVAQHVTTAMHLSVGKKSDAALTEAKKAVAADPSNAAARIALATALDDAEQSSEALEEAERATELAPLDGATHLKLGMLLFKQNKLEKQLRKPAWPWLTRRKTRRPICFCWFRCSITMKIPSMRRARHWRFRLTTPRSIIC